MRRGITSVRKVGISLSPLHSVTVPEKNEVRKFRITPQLLGLEETALLHVRQEGRRPQKRPEGRANRTVIAQVGYRTSVAKSGSFRNVYKSETLQVYRMPSKTKHTQLSLEHIHTDS